MKEFTLDGNKFNDLDSFYDEVQHELCPNFDDFGRNMHAFSDVLAGGFGTFEAGEPITLIWINSEKSKKDLPKDFDTIISHINSNKSVSLKLS